MASLKRMLEKKENIRKRIAKARAKKIKRIRKERLNKELSKDKKKLKGLNNDHYDFLKLKFNDQLVKSKEFLEEKWSSLDKKAKNGIIITGVLVAGAGLIDYVNGNKVFDGHIESDKVTYKENVGLPFFKRNIMKLESGSIDYKFVDKRRETPIDWDKRNANMGSIVEGRLEKIKMIDGNGAYVLHSSDNHSDEIEGVKSENFFKNSNKIYNCYRKKIFEKKRASYFEGLKNFEKGLKNTYNKNGCDNYEPMTSDKMRKKLGIEN